MCEYKTGRGLRSFVILFGHSPCSNVPEIIDLDVDNIGSAADRAILDVFLTGALRYVERHHDLLTAGIANIAGFVVHGLFLVVNGL